MSYQSPNRYPLHHTKPLQGKPYRIFVDTETDTTAAPGTPSELTMVVMKGDAQPWVTAHNEGAFYLYVAQAPADWVEVIAFNWEYDAQALHIDRWLPKMVLGDGGSIISVKGTQGPFWLKFQLYEKTIVLQDLTNLFPGMKLETLGRDLELPKLTMPIGGTEEQWQVYCRRDVEILIEAQAVMDGVMESLCGSSTTKTTIASTAMHVFTTAFMPEGRPNINTPRNQRGLVESYHGGRTDAFWLGEVYGYKYDVNSMYPSIMKRPMPARFSKRWTQEADPTGPYKVLMARMEKQLPTLVDVTLDIPAGRFYGGVPYKGATLSFPTGQFRGWYWDVELKPEWIVDVHEAIGFIDEPVFSDYVTTLYNLRMRYKRTGQKGLETMVKLLLNSLYGKFGQKEMGTWKALDEDLGEGHAKSSAVTNMQYLKTDKWYGKPLHRDLSRAHNNAAMQIASYITACGRRMLRDVMEAVPVYYCDTDSVIVAKPLPEDMVDNTELGKWKLEEEPGVYVIHGSKNYISPNGKVTRKGVQNTMLNTRKVVSKFRRSLMTDDIKTAPVWQEDAYLDIKPGVTSRHNPKTGKGWCDNKHISYICNMPDQANLDDVQWPYISYV